MPTADAAGDYLRLAEHYRQMKDPELLVLVRGIDGLTDMARQALETEIRHRNLNPNAEPEELSEVVPDVPEAPVDEESPYDEDRELVDLLPVWSQQDALQVQNVLDVAGIPFFMGPEKATSVAGVTSNFADGVKVKVMRIGLPWALQALHRDYFPEDDPTPEEPEQPKEIPVRCPRCQSTDVVFNGLVEQTPSHDPDEFPAAESSSQSKSSEAGPADPDAEPCQKFDWTCESCGKEWQDDGVVKES